VVSPPKEKSDSPLPGQGQVPRLLGQKGQLHWRNALHGLIVLVSLRLEGMEERAGSPFGTVRVVRKCISKIPLVGSVV